MTVRTRKTLWPDCFLLGKNAVSSVQNVEDADMELAVENADIVTSDKTIS